MRHVLLLHPDSRCAAVARIAAETVRERELVLRYAVSGRIADLRVPPVAEPSRAGELWQHTCFEAFVAAREGYYEFNFAPSRAWQAYRFDGYRSGRAPVPRIAAPRIDVRTSETQLELRVRLELPSDAASRLALAAVIEGTNGNLSYWALAHPPGKPDFHHPDCFALELPAPSAP